MKVKIIKCSKSNVWYGEMLLAYPDYIYEVNDYSKLDYKLKCQPLYLPKKHCEIIKENNMKGKLTEEDARELCHNLDDEEFISMDYNMNEFLDILKKHNWIEKTEIEQEIENFRNFISTTKYHPNVNAVFNKALSIITKLQDKIKEIEK